MVNDPCYNYNSLTNQWDRIEEWKMEQAKKPWQSKTMLLNGVGGLVLFAALFVPQAQEVNKFITDNAVNIGLAWSVLNMILRAVTKDKIGLTD